MKDTLSKARRAIGRAQFELDTNGINGIIDEVSVKYVSKEGSDNFLAEMVARGMDLFNSVDTVITYKPSGVSFTAHLDFLKYENKPWRIEVLRITDGESRLHDHISSGEIVHCSWKVAIDEFDSSLRVLRNRGYIPVAIAENDYGLLAYFGSGNPYLKLRAARERA